MLIVLEDDEESSWLSAGLEGVESSVVLRFSDDTSGSCRVLLRDSGCRFVFSFELFLESEERSSAVDVSGWTKCSLVWMQAPSGAVSRAAATTVRRLARSRCGLWSACCESSTQKILAKIPKAASGPLHQIEFLAQSGTPAGGTRCMGICRGNRR